MRLIRNSISLTPIYAVLLMLSACGKDVEIWGVKPIDPVVTAGSEALHVPEIGTLHPTLRWESATDAQHINANMIPMANTGQVSNVAYQLRIWEAERGLAGDVVYDKSDIRDTAHTVEIPLKPNTEYFWSVRATFDVDGRHRLSDWSLATPPNRGQGWGHRQALILGTIPAESYFRFHTP